VGQKMLRLVSGVSSPTMVRNLIPCMFHHTAEFEAQLRICEIGNEFK